jgi:hypothetical protein
LIRLQVADRAQQFDCRERCVIAVLDGLGLGLKLATCRGPSTWIGPLPAWVCAHQLSIWPR